MTTMPDEQNLSRKRMSEPEKLGDILSEVMRDIDKRVREAHRL